MLNHARSQRGRISRSKALGSFGTRTPPTTANALKGPATVAAEATFMDLWLTIAPDQAGLPLHTLVSEITSRLKSKARTDASDRRTMIIQTIIANFLQFPCIAVNLKRERATRYSRQAIKGEPLSLALGELEELGLIAIQPFQFKRLRTTIAPTPKLVELIFKHQVTTACTVRIPNEEVIILTRLKVRNATAIGDDEDGYDDDGEPFNQGGPAIDYPDNCAAANTLRTPLRQYNQFLSQSRIHIVGNTNAPPRPFAPFKRLFASDGTISFNLRGRLHGGQVGGWNQNLPKEQRHLIRINDESVCDLDFTNMHLRLAYREAKCPPPDGDLYAIKGLEAHRSAVKKVVLAMLAKTGHITKLPRGTRNQLPKQWNGKNIAQAIMQHHHAIAHIFGKGNSHRFTFQESQVLMETLCRLMNHHNVPALPMHDGLMVQASKRELAMKVMQEVAFDVLGVVLPVEEKGYP
jgi:hypothetical protein